jgi:HSP20 family protein
VLGRSYGPFARSFTLPDYVDIEKVSADLAHGVLTVRIPKLAAAKPRKIRIQAVDGAPKQLSEKSG